MKLPGWCWAILAGFAFTLLLVGITNLLSVY